MLSCGGGDALVLRRPRRHALLPPPAVAARAFAVDKGVEEGGLAHGDASARELRRRLDEGVAVGAHLEVDVDHYRLALVVALERGGEGALLGVPKERAPLLRLRRRLDEREGQRAELRHVRGAPPQPVAQAECMCVEVNAMSSVVFYCS